MAHAMFPESDAYASTNDATAQHTLGTTVDYYDATYGWQKLVYYYLTDAVATTAGHVVTFSHDAVGYVTGDISEGTAQFAGVALGVVSATYFGWFVCGVGNRCYVLTDGAATAQAVCMPHTGNNGEMDNFADGSEEFACGAFLVSNTTTTQLGSTMIITKGI